ncbi:MAG: hypothetical protein Q7U02_14785, partial [Desulfosalsimonadaceae bacterium]|nr:hypothetical protein [Desulfosalsimonadaceae bacterium]
MKPDKYPIPRMAGMLLICLMIFTGCDSDCANKLKIRITGDGGGVVQSRPAGIDCPSYCFHYFKNNLEVTLTATPDEGSEFAGWNGEGCSGVGNCVVIMDRDRTVTARFEKKVSALYRTRGNGFILEMAGDSYKWYEVTEKSLFQTAQGVVKDGCLYAGDCPAAPLDFFLSMSDPINELTDAEITAPTDDPIANFDVFWATFDEYYALFDLK